MPTYVNPVGDTSTEVVRIPIPVISVDLNGNAVLLGQTTMAKSQPVVLASDQLPLSTSITAPLPAIVQKANAASTGNVTTLAKAFTNNNVAGNSIIVVCGAGNNGTLSVTDTLTNTYTSAVTVANSTTFEAQIFYATNIAGGANTVTVTNAGAAASMAVQIYEVSGLIAQTGNILDQTTSSTGTSATPTASNIAPSFPNEFAFLGVAVGTAAQAVSATSGTFWTLDSTQNTTTPSGLFTFGALSQPLGSIKPVQPAATLAGSEPFAMVAASFRPVTVGASTVMIGGYNYTNMTTQTTTLIKTGPGVLHAVAVNKPVAAGTIELDDALTHTSPVIGTMTIPTTATNPFTQVYDVAFSTGLSVTTGGATQDITLIWK